MYSDVFRMYPRARVGKPSDTIKIQHARCEYKRILAHEGSMTLRYKVPYTPAASEHQPAALSPHEESECATTICDSEDDGIRMNAASRLGAAG